MLKKRIVTVFGIRPDIIRLSLIAAELDKWFDNITVDTGQHWDHNLNKVMYEQLSVREPNYRLETRADTQVAQVGRIMVEFEKVLRKEAPEFVVVLGDNNSSLAVALTAANLNIPIVHIESGGRSFNWQMPEEKNRTVVDHLATLHFCYTEEHRENLLREGIDARSIWVVGNPIVDVLMRNHNTFVCANNIRHTLGLQPYKYILATCHRSENTTDVQRLQNILRQLNELCCVLQKRMILIEMPKLRDNVEKSDYKYVEVIPPQPYVDFMHLMSYAALVISDSGTVPEECYALGRPCIQIREKTERVELLQNASTILVDAMGDIVGPAKFLLELHGSSDPPPYNTGVARKIISILLGNSLSNASKSRHMS